MTYFLETPWPAMLIGGLAALMIGSGWLRTGQTWLLYLLLAILALTVGAVVLERLVVTDREQVDATLHEIARLVEKNDLEAAFQYAHSPAVRGQAAGELPRYRFQEVAIARNLQIKVFPKHLPPKATAEFNVLVVFSTRDGSWSNQRLARYVEVTMLKDDDGQWRVSAYAHYDPMRGMRADDTQGPRSGSPFNP
jgi:hypothetical protein